MKFKLFGSLAVFFLTVSAPLFAHHGNVAYDNTKVVEVKNATVTKVS